ncbi:MAG TPA: HPr family phosphocarrier protein [Mycobacteriales bacterium]|nr:HPr family phosphocarrier protein [Mycobacteriales bacterium]
MSPSSEPPAAGGPAGAAPGGEESAQRSVVLPADLHARPAGRLTRAATGFAAVTTLVAGERSASARSVLAVMALGATAGTEVSVRAVGADAAAAAEALAAILATAD